MNKKIKISSIFLASSLIVTPVSSLVTNFDNVAKAEEKANLINKNNTERLGVGSATVIFFAGIAVGYIIDGVVVYYTGKGIPQHIADTVIPFIIDAYTKNPNSILRAFISNDGNVSFEYKKCIKYPCELLYSAELSY